MNAIAWSPDYRPWFVGLAIVGSFALFIDLGHAPLFLWDESMYCGATSSMRAGATWLYAIVDGHFDPVTATPPKNLKART